MAAFEQWKQEAAAQDTSIQAVSNLAASILLNSSVLTADILFLAVVRPGVSLSGLYKVAACLHAVPCVHTRRSQFTMQKGLVEFVTAKIHSERTWLQQLLHCECEGFESKLCQLALKHFEIIIPNTVDFCTGTNLVAGKKGAVRNLFHENEILRHKLRTSLAVQKSDQAIINKLTEDVFSLMQTTEAQRCELLLLQTTQSPSLLNIKTLPRYHVTSQVVVFIPPELKATASTSSPTPTSALTLTLTSSQVPEPFSRPLHTALVDIANSLLPGHAKVCFSDATNIACFVDVAGMVLDWVSPLLQQLTARIHDVSLLANDAAEMERIDAEGHDFVARLQFHSQLVQALDLYPFLGKVKQIVERTGEAPKCVVHGLIQTLERSP